MAIELWFWLVRYTWHMLYTSWKIQIQHKRVKRPYQVKLVSIYQKVKLVSNLYTLNQKRTNNFFFPSPLILFLKSEKLHASKRTTKVNNLFFVLIQGHFSQTQASNWSRVEGKRHADRWNAPVDASQ